MPFNSDSYLRNKLRREALELLTEARQLKAAGARYESPAKRARIHWRLYLSQRRICNLGRGINAR